MSTPLRTDTGVCAAKGSKVADHGGPPTCLGGLDITVVRQGRREGRSEAFGCRKRFLEETGQPGFKKKKKRASSAPQRVKRLFPGRGGVCKQTLKAHIQVGWYGVRHMSLLQSSRGQSQRQRPKGLECQSELFGLSQTNQIQFWFVL